MVRKVIHICLGKAKLDSSNGVNKVINAIASHQIQAGLTCEFWGLVEKINHNYELRNFQTKLFKNKFTLWIPNSLKKAIKDESGSIFHLHGGFILQYYAIAKYLKKKSIPYVITPHGSYNLEALKKNRLKKKLFYLFFDSKNLKYANKIQLLGKSEFRNKSISKFQNKISLIPNGQHQIESECIDVTQGGLIFGYVGRIDLTTKGLDILIHSFHNFTLKNNTKSELWIIGDGPDLTSIKNLIVELKLSQNVKLFGSVYGKDKINLIRRMSYLCLFSRNEGIPGVVLEALSCSVPVIISSYTNLGDYINNGKCGFVSISNNTRENTNLLIKASNCFNTDAYFEMQKKAAKLIQNVLSWEKIELEIRKLYNA